MSDKSERIFQSLSDISDQKVDEAARRPAGKRPVPRWRRWTAPAACLCLVAGATMLDAMCPSLDAMKEARIRGEGAGPMLEAGVKAAWAGAERTG